MLRQPLAHRGFGAEPGFRWRSREIARVEGFTDAVFAFAVTLLVVSLEVPHTFDQLIEMMSGFIAFAIGFALLLRVWYLQYLFFRRYGLEDGLSFTLNGALLFVILFFTYPLKFLFVILVKMFSGQDPRVHLPDGALRLPIESHQWDELMIIYGIGYMALFGALFLLYHHAWRRRESLELNAVERYDTRTSLQEFALNMGVALASIVIVLVGGPSWSIFAGFTYGLIGPIMATHGGLRGRSRRRLEAPPSG